MTYKVYLCGLDEDCPNDPKFEHRGFFGCVPKNFSERTGRSRTHRQKLVDVPGYGMRYRWDGGCDAAGAVPHHWKPEGSTPDIVLEMK